MSHIYNQIVHYGFMLRKKVYFSLPQSERIVILKFNVEKLPFAWLNQNIRIVFTTAQKLKKWVATAKWVNRHIDNFQIKISIIFHLDNDSVDLIIRLTHPILVVRDHDIENLLKVLLIYILIFIFLDLLSLFFGPDVSSVSVHVFMQVQFFI